MDMRRGDDAMAAGALAACAGLALYADALGCGRVYGYTAGSAVEFAIGTLAVVIGAWLLYLAGVYRDRARRTERRNRRARVAAGRTES